MPGFKSSIGWPGEKGRGTQAFHKAATRSCLLIKNEFYGEISLLFQKASVTLS